MKENIMVNKLKILKGYSKNNCKGFSFSCRWVGEIEVSMLARSRYFSGWHNIHDDTNYVLNSLKP